MAATSMSESDLTKAISDLADGFAALEREFRYLATQHDSLKAQLLASTEQNQVLKGMMSTPSSSSQQQPPPEMTDMPELPTVPPPPPALTTRSTVDIVMEVRGATDDADVHESVARIRDAELACFKIREKLRERRSRSRQPGEAGDGTAATVKRHEARVAFHDIEEDHTVARTPGQLGCPFARLGEGKGPPPPYARGRGLSTPRSGASHVGSLRSAMAPRSHRTSFNDPIKPVVAEAAAGATADASETSGADGGPACPIRFLGQHTPEDVAKYFEEHKHELPRSHEFCVKRFQSNAESIRQLDEKYGSLVNMIQGLGHKHQSMLPDAAAADEAGAGGSSQHGARSSQHNIRRWARAVSEGQPDDAAVPPAGGGAGDDDDATDALRRQQTVRSEGRGDVGEERVTRFDRPLKEIRVGESPSRPWGVPIPLKYLDRAAEPDGGEAAAPAAAPVAADTNKTAGGGKPDQKLAETPRKEGPPRPKGKCPFPHAAAAANAAAATTAPAPVKLVSPHPREGPMDAHPPANHDERAKPTAVPVTHLADQRPSTITNYGLAVIANVGQVKAALFENRGTLLLGYGVEDAIRLQRAYRDGQA